MSKATHAPGQRRNCLAHAAAYLRLHGTPRGYDSSHGDDYLAQLAAALAVHAGAGKVAWLIFDHTAAGAALQNAMAVRNMPP